MRTLLLSVGLVVIAAVLVCAIGLGVIHADAVLHASVQQAHLFAGIKPSDPVCPGAGSTGCH